ncbi:MAG TPA: hypothetical protein VHF45_01630 [Thermoleophilaceae bacterium]|nr:hypothetical protein [Thermoleophilaceae bacterium]
MLEPVEDAPSMNHSHARAAGRTRRGGSDSVRRRTSSAASSIVARKKSCFVGK